MQKIIKTILMMLAITPLIVDQSVFNAFITGKTFFLRIIVVITSLLILSSFIFIRRFRERVTGKMSLLAKSPIFLAISYFLFICIISTVFAVDKYIAFWGDVTRAEGLVGLVFFFAIFLFTILLFEKKDWLNFFKLSLVVSFIVLIKEFTQYFSGMARPSSFIGNPTFLAGYLLFSIFCAIVIFKQSQNKFWKYFSIFMIILSVLGIFIAETRGTIAGLGLGFIAILVYTIFKYRNNSTIQNNVEKKVINKNNKKNQEREFNYRKLAIIILSIIIVFSVFFIATRKNEMWQKVPGFSRIAQINLGDSTTNTRLLNLELGIKAINPVSNGWEKFLVGWGPDNFSLAYGQYFSPEQFNYEMKWFDRAHNKVIDLLIMNGLFGLLAYLSIYIILFIFIFKKEFSLIKASLLFIFTAFFIHLLFVFDNVATSLFFFIILSFASYYLTLDNNEKKEMKDKENNVIKYITTSFLVIISGFLVFVFFIGDLQSYIQMKKYDSIIGLGYSDYSFIIKGIDGVSSPFTIAQSEIRSDLMSFSEKNFDKNNIDMIKIGDIAIEKGEEYVKRNPSDSQFLIVLASDYTFKGNKLKNQEFLLKGEGYYRQMIAQVPNRPDAICGLALNLYYQGKHDEAFVNFEKSFDISPKFYQKEGDNVESIYTFFMQYFYEKRDKENFIKVADRLKENNYANGAMLDKVIEYMNKYNKWPNISFKSN